MINRIYCCANERFTELINFKFLTLALELAIVMAVSNEKVAMFKRSVATCHSKTEATEVEIHDVSPPIL